MKKLKIPTIIGLLILTIGVFASVILIKEGPRWLTRAAPETKPKQIQFTNLTDNGFSVSWITDSATSGFVKYGESNQLNQVARDDRDEMSGETGDFTTHHVTLRNLKPGTIYQLQIFSANQSQESDGQSLQVTTATNLTLPSPPSDVAYGTVNTPSGSPADGAIVYLSLPGVTKQSTLVKSSGNWVIALNLARSDDLGSYAQYDPQMTTIDLMIQGGNLGSATAVVTTKNDSPVPLITLGQNHDFREEASPLPQEEISEASTSSKFTLEGIEATRTATQTSEVTIANPSEEEDVNTQKPEFTGQGPAGKVLEILIESSSTYTDTIVIDESGNWHWTPPANLEPGEHTITITYKDDQGEEKALSHTFTVLAAGDSNLPSLTATSSGEASPSPSPSPSLRPSPSVTPSGQVSLPSTEAGVPESGYLTPTFLVFIMGLGLISFGLVSNILLKK
jgi:hypothetical protein